jgi:Predicted transcriptional regulators
MDNKKTGALIASVRKERGLTQKELAKDLHISDRTVSKWERGVGFPDVSLLEPLSQSLNLSISEIVLGEKSRNSKNSNNNDEEILKEALAILRRELVQQLHRKIIATSLAVVFPFFVSIFFWSFIPSEIGILVGTLSPFAPKHFVFTVPPIVLAIVNVIHVAQIDGKIDLRKFSSGSSVQLLLMDAPTNTLSGKLHMLFKRMVYWIMPAVSLFLAILTYISAFGK